MFGFRPDGKRVRDIDPIQLIIPHIMRHRHDSQNSTDMELPCEPFDDFIKEELAQGNGQYTYMHIVLASMVRTLAQFPRINRFIMNGRIYQHNTIQISFVVKKGMSADSPETTVKLNFTGLESIDQVREKVNAAIEANSHMEANNGTDKLVRLITFTPNIIIAFLVGTIKFLDRHGILPKAVIDVSPFHTSAFLTNMKSIKGPSIFHHLYDFGTTGVFISMGKESVVPVVSGGQIVKGKRMPFHVVMDERFCDGFYWACALRTIKMMLANPASLKKPLEALTEDVMVHDSHSFRKRNR